MQAGDLSTEETVPVCSTCCDSPQVNEAAGMTKVCASPSTQTPADTPLPTPVEASDTPKYLRLERFPSQTDRF